MKKFLFLTFQKCDGIIFGAADPKKKDGVPTASGSLKGY